MNAKAKLTRSNRNEEEKGNCLLRAKRNLEFEDGIQQCIPSEAYVTFSFNFALNFEHDINKTVKISSIFAQSFTKIFAPLIFSEPNTERSDKTFTLDPKD